MFNILERLTKGRRQGVENGERDGPSERAAGAEKEPWQIERIKTKVERADLIQILDWFSNPHLAKHIALARNLPENFDPTNEDDVRACLPVVESYYTNDGKPGEITTMIAENSSQKTIGAITIRWIGTGRWPGAEHIPAGKQRANLESLMVNPDLWGHGIGTRLTATAIEHAFTSNYYDGKPANEIRGWVLEDPGENGWGRSYYILSTLGFQPARDYTIWGEIVRRHVPEDLKDQFSQKEALWFLLRRKWYERAQKLYQDLSQIKKIQS